MGKTIFFHQDFYRQIELIPEENSCATQRYIEELPSRDGSIYGLKRSVKRAEQRIKIAERRIPLAELNDVLLTEACMYSNQIKSGYGSWTSHALENTVCWGFERYGIFAEHEDDTVVSLWLCNSHLFRKDNTGQVLYSKLLLLGCRYELILVDWDRELTVRIDLPDACRKYLAHELHFEI
ncbi:MAG: hypothetical protein LOY03_14120 [Cyclobacteriaceae bacterium]|jgi:hypothetical protein|nr:hypothetical protein [Cyclobacteriaceae bacterium]